MKKEVVDKIVERIMRQVLKNDYSQDIINSLSYKSQYQNYQKRENKNYQFR